MEPIAGIFPSRASAEEASRRLRERGFPDDRVSMLLPDGPISEDAVEAVVPTEDAEQSGVGQAIGGVVGGAAGASAGVLAASLLIPGVGAVTAVGLAAALFGAAGAVGGAKAGGALEKTRHGIPKDELYLYEDALSHGKGVVFAHPESDEEARIARGALESAGAESLEAARDAWWVGIRDVEKSHYDSAEGDFESAEEVYRQGFLAALQPEFRGARFEEVSARLKARFGDVVDHTAFRQGYARGAARARERSSVLEPVDRGV